MKDDLRERISQDIRSVVTMQAMRQKLVDMGGEVIASRPAQFRVFMQEETRKWQAAVRASGAGVD